MSSRWSLAILGLVAGAATMPVHACQLEDPVEIISGAVRARGEIRAVALVKVAKVELLPVPLAWPKGFPADWHASFDVERILRGSAKSRHFERQQQGGPGTCDFASAPKVGDVRILYIYKNNLVYDVDLEMARRIDENLTNVLPPKHRN